MLLFYCCRKWDTEIVCALDWDLSAVHGVSHEIQVSEHLPGTLLIKPIQLPKF